MSFSFRTTDLQNEERETGRRTRSYTASLYTDRVRFRTCINRAANADRRVSCCLVAHLSPYTPSPDYLALSGAFSRHHQGRRAGKTRNHASRMYLAVVLFITTRN